MKMDTVGYQTLISELKRDVVPACAVSIKADPMRVTLADAYEIRNLDKAMVKKLREADILALIAYGRDYVEQYRQGKFLYKKGSINKQGILSPVPGRTLLADFDETEAYNDIVASLKLLQNELNHIL